MVNQLNCLTVVPSGNRSMAIEYHDLNVYETNPRGRIREWFDQ